MSASNVARQLADAFSESYTVADDAATPTIKLSKTVVTLPTTTINALTVGTVSTGPAAAAGAVTPTIQAKAGIITTESLTTAQNVLYTLAITLTGLVSANVPILASVGNGTNTAGTPMIGTVTRTDANTLTIVVINKHATAVAVNGTLVSSYWILG
jgi:hypothetical protein